MELEAIADSISEKDDLIMINGNNNPQLMYLAHRKGWNCNNNQVRDTSFIHNIAGKGCKYIFINKLTLNQELNFKTVFSNDNFKVYKIP
jgi:hypothetical protein